MLAEVQLCNEGIGQRHADKYEDDIDSQTAYLNMTAELKGKKTYQLYRDYLENFRINYAVK